MDLDFLLFTPPKRKYTFMDFWGEVIFIPHYRKIEKKQKSQKGILSSLLNCYQFSTTSDNSTVIDNGDFLLSSDDGKQQLISQFLQNEVTNSDEKQQYHHQYDLQQQIYEYIPCLYLNSMVKSKYLLMYFHTSGQDIKLCYNMLNHLRNIYQVNVIAMQYPGYSIYQGKTISDKIKQNSLIVFIYCIKKLGFKSSNIIIIGRSIGTGIALQLLQKVNAAILVLISPFTSIKLLAKQFVGSIGHLFAKQTYDNINYISRINCPVFILHGKKDNIISWQNSIELSKHCYTKCIVKNPQNMSHTTFDFYLDFSDPLRQFLMQIGINFYEQNMKGPQIPSFLFKCPSGWKF